MGIAHKVGMQGNLQQRLLSADQFIQLGCSMKGVHAQEQGGERGLLLPLFIYPRRCPSNK